MKIFSHSRKRNIRAGWSRNSFGQMIVEYSLLIGVVIAVVVVLSPMVKRGAQGMVKIMADEVGIQKHADGIPTNSLPVGREAGLIETVTAMNFDREQKRLEWRAGITHSVQMNYDDTTQMQTNSASSLGTR